MAARTAPAAGAPAIRPLMKKVGVDLTPSSAPRPASVLTSVSAPRVLRVEVGDPADVARGLLRPRPASERRLVGEEPVLELIGRSLRAAP